jgi:hypothetical protein
MTAINADRISRCFSGQPQILAGSCSHKEMFFCYYWERIIAGISMFSFMRALFMISSPTGLSITHVSFERHEEHGGHEGD